VDRQTGRLPVSCQEAQGVSADGLWIMDSGAWVKGLGLRAQGLGVWRVPSLTGQGTGMLRSIEKQFQGGLVIKARRLLHHSTLGRE